MTTALLSASVGSWLVPLAAATVPAVASIGAAILAARSARASRAAELDAERIRDLEDRLAERKYDVYKPMIEMLRKMLDSKGDPAKAGRQAAMVAQLSEFAAWVSIFGSDEALRAFHNFMQGAFAEAPPTVLIRLYADFVIAARHDMGDTASTVTPTEILGLRINDLYSSDMVKSTSLPFVDLCEEVGWQAPWLRHSPSED